MKSAPTGEVAEVEIPRVSAQSENFSGFRLSPQKLNNLFRMHYIGGRLFFYTTVAVSLLCETGQVRIRAESPAQGGKSGHFCRDRRKTDSGQSRGGGLFGTSRKSGGPAQFRPGKCLQKTPKSREKINKPADFALGVGGYFSVESRAESRRKLTSPLIFDAKNQAAAGKGRGDWTSRTGLCGHFPETAIRRAVRNAPELEILPRTRSSAVGRQIPGGLCKNSQTLIKTVRRAPSPGGPWRRSILRRVSAPNLTPNFVV